MKTGQVSGDLEAYVAGKFEFLNNFSKGHLRLESEMLRIITEEYGFPKGEYQQHMEKHRWFLESFLVVLTKQMSTAKASKDRKMLQDMAKGGLVDTARWWYDHIRVPKPGEASGPDHMYRVLLDTLSMQHKLDIINRMTVYIATHDSTYWLKDIAAYF